MNHRNTGNIVLCILLFLLTSCDLFFGIPRGRENPDDKIAQLTYPRVAPNAPDSVMFSVTWKDAVRWMDDEMRIEEALVVWSTEGFLLSPTSPARLLSTYEEETLSSPGTFAKSVSGLSPGESFYVSFFGKMERGGWLQPLMRKASVSAGSTTQYVSVSVLNSYMVDKSTSTASPAGTNETIDSMQMLTVEMNSVIPKEAVVVSAELNLNNAFDGQTVRVAPVTRDWDGMDYYYLMENNLIGYASSSVETGSGGSTYATVNKAAGAAQDCGTNMLIIDMPFGGALNITIASLSLDIYYAVP